MAALTTDVDPDATKEYLSLNAAETAEKQDLTNGGGDTWTCTTYSTGGTADTTPVFFVDWVTDVGEDITVTSSVSDRATPAGFDSNKYRLSVTDELASIRTQVNYLNLDGLQIEMLYSSGSDDNIFYLGGADAGNLLRFSNCYLRGDGGGNNDGIRLADADLIVEMYKCIITNVARYGINDNPSASLKLFNSIIQGCGNDGIESSSGIVIIKNTAIFDTADDFDVGGATETIDYCASDDGDGGNAKAPSGSDWDNEYVDSANGDFRLVASGNCEGGGTDDPSGGDYSTDMDGDAYTSPWSIGVDAKAGEGGAAYDKTITDTVGITDTVTTLRSTFTTIADAVGVTDVLTTLRRVSVTLADVVGITDVLSRVVSYVRTLTSTVNITDGFPGAKEEDILNTIGITDVCTATVILGGAGGGFKIPLF